MPRNKIHLYTATPHRYEIEDMLVFCNKYKHLYICGAAKNQEYMLKYLDACGIKVDGYTVTNPDEQNLCYYRHIPIKAIDEVIFQPDTGVILALSDKYYRSFIPKFRKAGFSDYFIMTEHSKKAIAERVRPRTIETMQFEINLVDHCNISCQMCDHYSQLSDEWFVNIEDFERDMIRMGELFNNELGLVQLLGGEPALHPELIRCIEITRRIFPETEIVLLTNGILLPKLEDSPKGNLWQVMKDNDIHIIVTMYPLKFDYSILEKKANEYGVLIEISSNIHLTNLSKETKTSNKRPFDLTKKAEKAYFPSCGYFNKWNVLKDGRYYMCPVSAHIDIFNKAFGLNMQYEDADFVDIYKAKSWHELSEFSANVIPFCCYCDLKNWRPHSKWKASTKTIDEYVDVIPEV